MLPFFSGDGSAIDVGAERGEEVAMEELSRNSGDLLQKVLTILQIVQILVGLAMLLR
ncbi:hypothetical protein ABZ815_20325 [Nonomuraea sp. NPDC047529]|uniref:hypothetical protein n=1 Tax=Nonomuraea sp. NPDC047529 TaxID=3155623 RepID=UPI0033D2D3E2